MSEEADMIVWLLQWVARCMQDRYVIRGRTLSYFAYECNLATEQAHMIWFSVNLKQEIAPPGVILYSPSMREEAERFNQLPWVKEKGLRAELVS